MDKAGVGGGSQQMRWINKFLNVNIINFAKVDKEGGGGYETKVDNLPLCFHLS